MSKELPAGSPFTEVQIVDWLVDECRDVAGRVTTVTTSGDRIFATGSTVIALAATVAVGGGRGYLLMWLPLAVSIVILHGLYLNNVVRNLIGYQIGLEKEIARRVGLPLIAWQTHIRKGGRSHRQVKTLLLTAFVVYVASAVIGLSQALHTTSPGAWGHERSWLYITLTAANVVCSAGLISYAFLSQRGAMKAAARHTEEAFAAAVPSSAAPDDEVRLGGAGGGR